VKRARRGRDQPGPIARGSASALRRREDDLADLGPADALPALLVHAGRRDHAAARVGQDVYQGFRMPGADGWSRDAIRRSAGARAFVRGLVVFAGATAASAAYAGSMLFLEYWAWPILGLPADDPGSGANAIALAALLAGLIAGAIAAGTATLGLGATRRCAAVIAGAIAAGSFAWWYLRPDSGVLGVATVLAWPAVATVLLAVALRPKSWGRAASSRERAR
jgi:hypothetical protein